MAAADIWGWCGGGSCWRRGCCCTRCRWRVFVVAWIIDFLDDARWSAALSITTHTDHLSFRLAFFLSSLFVLFFWEGYNWLTTWLGLLWWKKASNIGSVAFFILSFFFTFVVTCQIKKENRYKTCTQKFNVYLKSSFILSSNRILLFSYVIKEWIKMMISVVQFFFAQSLTCCRRRSYKIRKTWPSNRPRISHNNVFLFSPDFSFLSLKRIHGLEAIQPL